MKAKYFGELTVKDPETGGDVILELYRHQNGAIMGIDSSFLESIGDFATDGDENNNIVILDPFADIDNNKNVVELL